MADPIRGKVAQIINSQELVINRGSQAGVREGMRFAVLEAGLGAIRDPDTGEDLGSIQRTKVQVEVTQVRELLSVAGTYRSKRVNVGGVGGFTAGEVGRLFTPPRWVEQRETLKASDAKWEPLTEEQSIVKIGDPVVQINVDDDDEVSGILSPDELQDPSQADSN
jgi:hypothetical protein